MRESVLEPRVQPFVPSMSEADLQKLITDAATLYGWSYLHLRAGQNRHGQWSVPVSGPLGEGWPDLFLAHPRQGRLLAIECKAKGPVSTAQLGVHAVLVAAGLEVLIVRPADIDTIIEVLRCPL